MGMYAAYCMQGSTADTGTGFAFELFTHATQFMGQKVVLLGLYNGQGLEKEPESDIVMYSRASEVRVARGHTACSLHLMLTIKVCLWQCIIMQPDMHLQHVGSWQSQQHLIIVRLRFERAMQGDNPTFVRVLLLRGKMAGAVLIGETGLEETFENLILDGLDLSSYGPALLDPDMEIDHMFD